MFPNEINEAENTLLQTIYIPKKLSHLTERLPKSTYEDNNESDDDGTVMSKFLDATMPDNDSLPRIPAKKLPSVGMGSQPVLKMSEHKSQLAKHSDYSFDSQSHKVDEMPAISKSVAPISKGTVMFV